MNTIKVLLVGRRWSPAISIIALLILCVQFLSCKKDTPVDPQTIRIADLSGSWVLGSVLNDNLDVTGQYDGFRLIITGLSYTTENGGNPWPASGTYDFRGDDLDVIFRSDGTEVDIDQVTSTTLILSFNSPLVAGNRTSGVTGDFTFSLIKE